MPWVLGLLQADMLREVDCWVVIATVVVIAIELIVGMLCVFGLHAMAVCIPTHHTGIDTHSNTQPWLAA